MAIYNWADESEKRRAKCFDVDTGEEVRRVFYYDDGNDYGWSTGMVPSEVGRYDFDPATDVIRIVDNKPVEIWEDRQLRIEWLDDADSPHLVAAATE